jgi:ABC-type multidrug transport system fused ATPase/permease subunit
MTEEVCDNIERETNWAPFASVVFTTLGGMSIGAAKGGVQGALIGGAIAFASSSVDEALIATNIASKHYISSSLFWSQTIQIPSHEAVPSIVNSAAKYALSYRIAYSMDDYLDFSNKINLPVNSFLTLYKVLDGKNISSTYKKNYFLKSSASSLALSIGKIIIDHKINNRLGVYGNDRPIITLIQMTKYPKNNGDIFSKYYEKVRHIIIFNSLKIGLALIVDLAQQAMSKLNNQIILDANINTLTSDDNSRKLKATGAEGQKIISSLTNDLFNLKRGSTQLSNIITQSLSTLEALYNVIKYDPRILLPYSIGLMIKQEFLRRKVKESEENAKKSKALHFEAEETLGDLKAHADQISLRDGTAFIKNQFNQPLKALNKLQSEATYLEIYKSLGDSLFQIYHHVIDSFLLVSAISNKVVINRLQMIYTSMGKLFSFFFSNLETKKNNIDSLDSLGRINKLIDLIDEKVERASHEFHQDNRIIIQNYTLKFKQQELISLDFLAFESAKHYAITGKSGCGKSSMLIDLVKGVVPPLSSSGEFYIPENQKIMFLDQDLYLPEGIELKKIIYFPSIFEDMERNQQAIIANKIIALLEELEVFSGNRALKHSLESLLDDKKVVFSGGQRKKIGIIQAILAQPDILILDEVFTGLDERSLINIQHSLKKYLPNATILSVDHHADDNNYDQFYDKEIHFHSYEFKSINSPYMMLQDNEIGFYLAQGQLFCKVNDHISNLRVTDNDISVELYNKILDLLGDGGDSADLSLLTEEQQQIKNFILNQNYSIRNVWVTVGEIASQALREEYIEKNAILCSSPLYEDILSANPKELDAAQSLLHEQLCGICSCETMNLES